MEKSTTGRKIKAMYYTQPPGLTHIQVPTNTNDNPNKCHKWTTIDTPDKMTKYPLAHNRLHLGQATGTLFTIEPLLLSIVFCASTSSTSSLIITGDYNNAELDAITQLFLKSIKNKAPLDVLPAMSKEDKIMEKFSIWPEKTTISPSGRYLVVGHYHSLLQTELPKGPLCNQMECERAAMTDIHRCMINLALAATRQVIFPLAKHCEHHAREGARQSK
jgi:hypothetical protein